MGADDGGPDNYIDFQRNYTVTSRNRKHTFVQGYVYELPFGKNKHFLNSAASWILGGWGVTGVLTRMSGTPLHFTANGNRLNAHGSTQYPNQVAPFHVLGPGLFNLDAAVFRNFPIREKIGLELRPEAFSLTNTAHFSNPSVSLTSSNCGHITGTGDQNSAVGDGNRVVELSGKFTF